MIPVTLSELRANIAKYFDRVENDRDELVVMRRNHEPMVVMPLSEWEGMKETLHPPANAEHLRKSIANADAGKLFERDLIER